MVLRRVERRHVAHAGGGDDQPRADEAERGYQTGAVHLPISKKTVGDTEFVTVILSHYGVTMYSGFYSSFLQHMYTLRVSATGEAVHTTPQKQNDIFRHVHASD